MSLNNPFKNTQFLKSAINFKDFPKDSGIEIAFAGRSNAGKSTVINTITGINKLAKTSNTPGRTRTLNFFELTKDKRIVDLPGFGFAKIPKNLSCDLELALEHYLINRQSLKALILIMDARHPFKPIEEDIITKANQANIKTAIILNKADKLSKIQQKKCLNLTINKTKLNENIFFIQLFSSTHKIGINFVIEKIISLF